MKLKSYILTGVIITLTITSFFIGRSYESYKLKALEVSNVSSNEEIDNENKESNKEELSEEQLHIKEIILNDKDGLFGSSLNRVMALFDDFGEPPSDHHT